MRTYSQFALKRIEFLINLLLYMENKEIKEMVKQKYSVLALQNDNQSSCCGSDNVYNIMNEDYSQLDGYEADADLGLGCGLPTAFAGLKKGDFVLRF